MPVPPSPLEATESHPEPRISAKKRDRGSFVKGPSGITGPPSSSPLSTLGADRKKKVDALLAGSKLSMLQSGKYIEPSEVSTVSRRQLKKERKAEREKTNGPGWFNMGAPELTTERKNDMEALRLRSVLETKRFYKRNNMTSIPKYFQVGRVVETPADYYSSRIPNKQRKQTVAEELVADLE